MTYHSIPLPLVHSQVNPSLEVRLYPTADLNLRFYLVRSPSGFREVEFHCNRAAIAPLIKCGWAIVSARECAE